MIVYKLTDKDGYCRRNRTGETFYQVGETYTSDGDGDLCTGHWRHAYEHPLFAVLHDPAHGEYGKTARLWECDTLDGTVKKDGMMKLGTTKLKVLREVKKPEVTLEQRIAYAISCSLRVYAEESYVVWAENWLSGKDRSRRSTYTTYNMAVANVTGTAYAAAEAAASAAADAARAAGAYAEEDAAYAAAVYAADAAAVSAAENAETIEETIDLLDCAREVYLID